MIFLNSYPETNNWKKTYRGSFETPEDLINYARFLPNERLDIIGKNFFIVRGELGNLELISGEWDSVTDMLWDELEAFSKNKNKAA